MSQENVEVARTPLSTTTRRSRTLDERVYVRFPMLLPRIVAALMRLRPRSRVRRTLLSFIVRRGWAASDRGDLDLCLCGYDPEVEISWPASGGLAFPDLSGVYRGHEGFRQVWLAMHDPWDVDIQLEEMIDAGTRLLVVGQVAVRGSGSGISVSGPLFAVHSFRAGRIVREQFFNDREEALEAVGLRE
jgi:ketosteroid isomerase-like protein